MYEAKIDGTTREKMEKNPQPQWEIFDTFAKQWIEQAAQNKSEGTENLRMQLVNTSQWTGIEYCAQKLGNARSLESQIIFISTNGEK